MKKLPFELAKEVRTTQPLQMAHTDVGGPITPASREGYKYWMVIVDDFTCFPWVYFMKHKSEAVEAIPACTGEMLHPAHLLFSSSNSTS